MEDLDVHFRSPANLRVHSRRIALILALLAVAYTYLPVIGVARAAGSVTWVQGTAISTGTRVASTTTTLTGPVGAGDLLVGWFAEYNASGQVQVSDDSNGAWTRASAATAFQNGTG